MKKEFARISAVLLSCLLIFTVGCKSKPSGIGTTEPVVTGSDGSIITGAQKAEGEASSTENSGSDTDGDIKYEPIGNAAEGLPPHLLTGYWHNFDNGAKCLKISEVPASYNIIAVAFAEATQNNGEITFSLDEGLSKKLGGYTKEEFIKDIKNAEKKGQRVILSVGGELGAVSVNDEAAAKRFADSAYEIIKEYGFHGIDIDLENGLNPEYMAKALRSLSEKFGSGMIITMAPQTIDMQSTSGGYFKLALEIKDILTIVNLQYYNSGSMAGQDGNIYSQGNVEFLTALAAIQLENGLRPDQVGLGLPSSPKAAGGGYVEPSVVVDALNSLASGTKAGGYTPPRSYPDIRGAMTWSINWDASNNYAFANRVGAELLKLPKPQTSVSAQTTKLPAETEKASQGTEKVPSGDEWTVGKSYSPGDTVTYNGKKYKCLQEHSAQTDWDPVRASALWSAV